MFSDFKFLLNRAVRRSGASDYVDEKTVLNQFRKHLESVFEKDIDEKFQIIDFSNGVINVASLCEMNAENLKNKESDFIDKINKKLNKPVLKKINVIT